MGCKVCNDRSKSDEVNRSDEVIKSDLECDTKLLKRDNLLSSTSANTGNIAAQPQNQQVHEVYFDDGEDLLNIYLARHNEVLQEGIKNLKATFPEPGISASISSDEIPAKLVQNPQGDAPIGPNAQLIPDLKQGQTLNTVPPLEEREAL